MKKLLLTASALIVMISCKKDQPEMPAPELSASVKLEFEHIVKDEPLMLESTTYSNALGQNYTVSSWKYFISNIAFYQNGEEVYAEKDSYHYINEADETTAEITLAAVPTGEYDEIRFAFGIDSTNNNGDARVGDVDPSTGMLWPMAGYRFSNFDGSYGSTGLAFHVGGNSNYREMSFANNIYLNVKGGQQSFVHCMVDLDKMFSSVHVIDFDSVQSLASESGTAPLADNIASGMFMIHHIENP